MYLYSMKMPYPSPLDFNPNFFYSESKLLCLSHIIISWTSAHYSLQYANMCCSWILYCMICCLQETLLKTLFSYIYKLRTHNLTAPTWSALFQVTALHKYNKNINSALIRSGSHYQTTVENEQQTKGSIKPHQRF